MSKLSMRQIAKELEISPAYLSYMLNGKRPWRKDLYQRYMGVVNTFVNSDDEGVNSQTKRPPQINGLFRRGKSWCRERDSNPHTR